MSVIDIPPRGSKLSVSLTVVARRQNAGRLARPDKRFGEYSRRDWLGYMSGFTLVHLSSPMTISTMFYVPIT